MEQQQLAFQHPDDTVDRRADAGTAARIGAAGPPPPPPARPSSRDRQALVRFLDEVARRVAPTRTSGAGARPGGADSRAGRRNTLRNARMIAARARRALDALPEPDLELLGAYWRLLAAISDAVESFQADGLSTGGATNFVPAGTRYRRSSDR